MIPESDLRAIFRAEGMLHGADFRALYVHRVNIGHRIRWRCTDMGRGLWQVRFEVPEEMEMLPRDLMEEVAHLMSEQVQGRRPAMSPALADALETL